MFPLRDDVPSRRLPAVVWALVFINAAIFLHEVNLTSTELQIFVYRYALIPARITMPGGVAEYWPTLITSMFLHGSWLHIISNMWFLWIFGDNVEDRFGSLGFLVFYFLGGLAAAALEIYVDPLSQVPSLGASGAIAAVAGAYLVFYPTARVITLIPLFIIPWFVSIPAVVWLGVWFLQQYLNGLGSLYRGVATGGIAYWAHVGGFLFGVAVGVFARLTVPGAQFPGPGQPLPETGNRVPRAGRQPFYYGYDREWPFG